MSSINRREFVALAAALPLAAASSSTVRLGGPVFIKTSDPVLLAKEHRRLGYGAAYCPGGLKAGQTQEIEAARKAFAAENVVIAEVGAWVNMLEQDAAKRRTNMQYVAERFALGDEIGALCCVDIGGSYNPKMWDGPDPRDFSDEYMTATVENCRTLIDAVKPKHTKFTIEMMGWALPNDPGSYLRLIKAVDRPNFGVHVDVCNIIDSPQRYYGNTAVINEVFKRLGPWIVSCHAKDVGPFATHFTEVIPGRGGIDYKAYLKGVSGLGRQTPLMLEHLQTAAEYEEGRRYIQSQAAACGVAFT